VEDAGGFRRTWVKYLFYTAFRIVGTAGERGETLPVKMALK
jgi:hypothetical protein